MKAGKIWGKTEALFNQNNVELHRIEVERGGYCSKHKHEHKWNMFFVESGELEVIVWTGGGVHDSTLLIQGDNTAVPPGVFHQFRAITDVVAYEIYWTDLSADDIVRETVGGKA
jgi:mannose-6-phosphate isomerase-like protein (cupin superfamily)